MRPFARALAASSLFLLATTAFASSPLSTDREWELLLHYRGRILGGKKSEIAARDFFLSENGRTDPEAELQAALRAMQAPVGPEGSARHAQCRFPDRYAFLKEHRALGPTTPEIRCAEYLQWRKDLDPESVTLIFSSYYMGNPSSVFGHTLLRLNHRGHGENERLLDYGVNYSANVTTSNALAYAYMGLTGGFPGLFSNIPYFMKVEEYNNVESRDLWEYDLSFTPGEIDRLLRHLWALGRIQIPYYFLSQNCSYMLLTLLDVARPGLELSEKFGAWVIPADTVRAVTEKEGLVTKVTHRPSITTKLKARLKAMSGAQRELFASLVGATDPVPREELLKATAAGKPSEVVPALDAAMDYMRLRKTLAKGKLSPELASLQKSLLLARSRIPSPSEEFILPPEESARLRPDQGHATEQAHFSTGKNSASGPFVELGIRPAFHDLNAQAAGYPAGAQIEIANLRLRYRTDSAKLALESLDIAHVMSVPPLESYFSKASWELWMGTETIRHLADCPECHETRVEGGYGATVAPIRDHLQIYALAKARAGYSGAYLPRYELGPGATAGVLAEPFGALGLQASYRYYHPVAGDKTPFYVASGEARISAADNVDFRLQYDLYKLAREGRVTFNVYF